MSLTTKQIIALQSIKGVGIKSILKVGDYSSSFINDENLVNILEKAKVKKTQDGAKFSITQTDVEHALIHADIVLNECKKQNIGVISYYDENFPISLKKALNDKGKEAPCIILYYKGNIALINECSVAIIGSRKSHESANIASKMIANIFANFNVNIVSGLALGCDTAAHLGALESAKGKTIAILANGLDSVYPKENEKLSNDILNKGGLLLSEYMMGVNPSKFTFVERDRLQAAISRATIVAQSKVDGGSMHAALATFYENKPLYTIKYKDEKLQNSEDFEGNRVLEEKYRAISIGGYTKTELINKIKSISEELIKNNTSLDDDLLDDEIF